MDFLQSDIDNFLKATEGLESSTRTSYYVDNAIKNSDAFVQAVEEAKRKELAPYEYYRTNAPSIAELQNDIIEKNSYKFATSLHRMSNLDLFYDKEGGIAPVVFELGQQFKKAAGAAGVDDSRKFLDVFFENVDWSKHSGYAKLDASRRAMDLEQIALGVRDKNERDKNVHSFLSEEYGKTVADILYNKLDDHNAPQIEMVKSWLAEPASSETFEEYMMHSFTRPEASKFMQEGDVASTLGGYSTTLEKKRGADAVVEALYSVSPVPAMEYGLAKLRGATPTEEMQKKAIIGAASFGLLAATPLYGAGLASVTLPLGAIDIGYGGFGLITGRDPLHAAVYGFGEAPKLGLWERALYGIGAGLSIVPTIRAITPFQKEVKGFLSSKLGSDVADEVIAGGRNSVAATFKSFSNVSDEDFLTLMRYADEAKASFNATDEDLFELLQAVEKGYTLNVDEIISRNARYKNPITSLARNVAASGDKNSRKMLHRLVAESLSRDDKGNLTEVAKAAVKALDESNPQLSSTIIRDVRSVGNWRGTNVEATWLHGGAVYEDPSLRIVEAVREQQAARSVVQDFDKYDSPIDVKEVDLGDIIPDANSVTVDDLITAWQKAGKKSTTRWGEKFGYVQTESGVKPVIENPEVLPKAIGNKQYTESGFDPRFTVGARIRLSDGSDVIVSSIDMTGKTFTYVDKGGVEKTVNFLEEVERKLFLDEMKSLGVKEIK